jgi:hypothetical protein
MIRKGPLTVPASNIGRALDLAQLASFEVSSEDAEHPLEGMLGEGRGWRAAETGPQTIRLAFDSPQDITHISLLFREERTERMQEFLLSWRGEGDGVYRELRRQQFNFSPPNTVLEREEFQVSLRRVTGFELHIQPAVSGSGVASIECLRIE